MMQPLEGSVQAVTIWSEEKLSISEFFSPSSSADFRVSACLATLTGACGQVVQKPEYDEYLMVLSGEVVLERDNVKGSVRKGEGVLLKAQERVVWHWDQPSQYVIISQPASGASSELGNKESAAAAQERERHRLQVAQRARASLLAAELKGTLAWAFNAWKHQKAQARIEVIKGAWKRLGGAYMRLERELEAAEESADAARERERQQLSVSQRATRDAEAAQKECASLRGKCAFNEWRYKQAEAKLEVIEFAFGNLRGGYRRLEEELEVAEEDIQRLRDECQRLQAASVPVPLAASSAQADPHQTMETSVSEDPIAPAPALQGNMRPAPETAPMIEASPEPEALNPAQRTPDEPPMADSWWDESEGRSRCRLCRQWLEKSYYTKEEWRRAYVAPSACRRCWLQT